DRHQGFKVSLYLCFHSQVEWRPGRFYPNGFSSRPPIWSNRRGHIDASIVGHVITVSINGTQLTQITGNTFSTGNQGIGFFLENRNATGNIGDFGFTNFTASNSPIGSDTTPPNAPRNLTVST